MPTYEYRCENCRHEFEQFQAITAKALRKCPECGKNRLQRLIGTGAGVIFKGSGFYETDYRSDSYKKAAKAEKDAASGKSDDKKGDSADKSKDTGTKNQTTPKKSNPNSTKKD